MAALAERKLDIVRTLVETAPDKIVEGLRQALAAAGTGTALASVRDVVEFEASDRRLRNAVLAPIAPMCVGDGGDPLRLTFPAQVTAMIWRALKAQAPAIVRNAEVALYNYQPGESSADHFDRLVRLTAKGLRAAEIREFRAVREACDAARPSGAAALLACLEVSPVVRSVAHTLSDWTTYPSADVNVAARLAYKDAVAISEDAGPTFFHMLAAQLQNPCMILRIISAVMEKPTERYLADSELGVFGERVLRDVEVALAEASKLDPDGGVQAALEAAAEVARLATAASELETNVELSREHGWGKTLFKQRTALAAMVEARCHEAEKCFDKALPCSRGGAKRGSRGRPRLQAPPDEAAVSRCRTLLTFISELRSTANYGGFAAARTRLLEALGDDLDHYVQELLDVLKAGEAESAATASAFLVVAADFSALVRDEKAAELVRRRAAAAAAPAPVDPVQSLLTGT